MKKNMGKPDRIIRTIIALIILGLYFGGIINDVVATILLVTAVVFLFTSSIGFCPIYAIFKVNTCKTDD